MFQSNYDRLGRGFWEHAALAYLVGDDFGRMLGYRTDHPGSAPKLHTVTLRKTLGLGDGLFIVGAHQRFVSIEVTVIAYTVSAVIRHHRAARRPGDVSHSLKRAAVAACRARRISRSRSIPGWVPFASFRRRCASWIRRWSSGGAVGLKRRCCCIARSFPLKVRRERYRASHRR